MGTLPLKIEAGYSRKGDKELFRLPCLYFEDRCSIYYKKKASICAAYRCQLLKVFASKKVTQTDGIKTVSQAKAMRQEIFDLYHLVTGNSKPVYFKQIMRELWEMMKETDKGNSQNQDFEVLIARCNIFEALLIKHFRSEKDFESMIADE